MLIWSLVLPYKGISIPNVWFYLVWSIHLIENIFFSKEDKASLKIAQCHCFYIISSFHWPYELSTSKITSLGGSQFQPLGRKKPWSALFVNVGPASHHPRTCIRPLRPKSFYHNFSSQLKKEAGINQYERHNLSVPSL